MREILETQMLATLRASGSLARISVLMHYANRYDEQNARVHVKGLGFTYYGRRW